MALAIILIILLALWVVFPALMRILRPVIQRWAMRRMENYIRRAAGVPPSGSDSRSRSRSRESRGRERREDSFRSRTHGREESASGKIIPPEYAEDVEFTETKIYSSDSFGLSGDDGDVDVKIEDQVSDAEWTEIRTRK